MCLPQSLYYTIIWLESQSILFIATTVLCVLTPTHPHCKQGVRLFFFPAWLITKIHFPAKHLLLQEFTQTALLQISESYYYTHTHLIHFPTHSHFFLTQTHYRHLSFTVSPHTHSVSSVTDSWKDSIWFSQLPVCPSRCDSHLHIDRLNLRLVSPAIKGCFVHF